MTSVAKASSSSSSIASESLQSSSYDSGFPVDFNSPLPIEPEIEQQQQSYDDEDFGEATFIPPSMSWQQPESPVAIVLAPHEFCSVTEVQGEVQRLEDEISQGHFEAMQQAKAAIAIVNDHSALYLDTSTTPLSENTPRTAEAYPPYMPAEYILTHTAKSNIKQEDFQDWQPDLQTKKRGREEAYKGKGKGKGRSRDIDYSSDGVASDNDGGILTEHDPYNRSIAGRSSIPFREDIFTNTEDKTATKRKIITCKPLKAGNRGPADSGWQSSQLQWRKLVNLTIPQDPKKRSHWPPWLHPCFRIEDDGIVPRISHPDLQM